MKKQLRIYMKKVQEFEGSSKSIKYNLFAKQLCMTHVSASAQLCRLRLRSAKRGPNSAGRSQCSVKRKTLRECWSTTKRMRPFLSNLSSTVNRSPQPRYFNILSDYLLLQLRKCVFRHQAQRCVGYSALSTSVHSLHVHSARRLH